MDSLQSQRVRLAESAGGQQLNGELDNYQSSLVRRGISWYRYNDRRG